MEKNNQYKIDRNEVCLCLYSSHLDSISSILALASIVLIIILRVRAILICSFPGKILCTIPNILMKSIISSTNSGKKCFISIAIWSLMRSLCPCLKLYIQRRTWRMTQVWRLFVISGLNIKVLLFEFFFID